MKIDLKSFFKLKKGFSLKPENRHYVFAFLALFMLVIVSILIIWSIAFLISNFAEAFTETPPPVPTQRFDIEGFEDLNLVK
ncbi:MAG: hypothetical protein V2A55_01580 [Candidatus Jorgensenbacteria bacterium]